MNRAKLRLAIAILLFGGWLGFLAYLALLKANPVVVSRWQMMAATHAVVAQITLDSDGRPKVTAHVEQVFPEASHDGPAVGQDLELPGLPKAHLPSGKPFTAGEGRYLIPLTKEAGNQFRVVALPPSPGYDFSSRLLIYPWTPDVERQVRELLH
jgi:hypothetical protein